MSSRTMAVVDVGGTSIKTGAVEGDHVRLGPSFDANAQADRDTAIGALVAAGGAALDLAGGDRHDLVVSIPGPFDHERGVSLMDHKFGSIRGIALRPVLGERLGDRLGGVAFVDDAEAMALGAVSRAGLDDRRVLVIALGTGFGSALVEGRRALRTVGDVTVGRLWERPAADARTLDTLVSATGLADALSVEADDLPAALTAIRCGADRRALDTWADATGGMLATIVDELGAAHVLVAGGAAPVLELVEPRWVAAMGRPVERATGDGLALLGAALAAQAASA